MAEPIGIIGTVCGIISLGFEVYHSLEIYIEDFKTHGIYVEKMSQSLNRLQLCLDNIKTIIPSFEKEHAIPSQTVGACLGDCEAELKSLDLKIRKYAPTTSTDRKGKMKEARTKLIFPFARPEIDKLASQVDRINNLLMTTIQVLALNVQLDICDSTHAITTDVTSILAKMGENNTGGVVLVAGTVNNQVIEQDGEVPLSASTELLSLGTKINRVQAETSRNECRLGDIHSSKQPYQQSITRVEDKVDQLMNLVIQNTQNSPGQELFQMLMSRPAVLRSWQNELAATRLDSSTNRTGSESEQDSALAHLLRPRKETANNCGCRYHRRKTESISKWSFFTYFDESAIEFQHESGCPKYQHQVNRQRTVGLIYMGLCRLLSIALSASITITHGAGGASISPTFKYYAVVDGYRLPSFRIVWAVTQGIQEFIGAPKHSEGPMTPAEVETACRQILCYGVSKLRSLSSIKAASPSKADVDGSTQILETLAMIGLDHLTTHGTFGLRIIRAFLTALLEHGRPSVASIFGIDYSSVVYNIADSSPKTLIAKEQTYIVESLAPLVSPITTESCDTESNWHLLLYPVFPQLLEGTEAVTKPQDLDTPLFSALLQKDAGALEHVLQGLPISSREMVVNGVSAVHFAVFWPKGLKMLLDTQLDLDIDLHSGGFITPFWLAIKTSQRICKDEPPTLCSNCSCSESVKILLDYKCYLHRDLMGSYLYPNKFRPSTRAAHTLLMHIRYWRKKLEEIARRELSESEYLELGLCNSSVLDYAAPEVISKLEARAISPYREWRLHPNDYRLSPSANAPWGTSSIYHEISTADTAQIAFDLGFRDIDAVYKGRTPVMQKQNTLEYCGWLIFHGASPTNLVPWVDYDGPSKLTVDNGLPRHIVAHTLMWKIGKEFDRICHHTVRHSINGALLSSCLSRFNPPGCDLIRKLCVLQVGDGCECACSEQEEGCSPLLLFLNWSYMVAKFGQEREELTIWIHEHLLADASSESALHIAFTAIRALTFHALNIRHTCCTMIPRKWGYYHMFKWTFAHFDLKQIKSITDDFPHIRKEDESLLDEFEELMDELKEEFCSGAYTLSDFLKGYWRKRLEQVQKAREARRFTETELEGLTELGVRLRKKRQHTIKDPLVDIHRVEYWVREIDKIV